MWTAGGAILWESWRLTRWRLLLVPALATFCGWLWSRNAGSFLAFVVLFTVGIAMALSLPSFGDRPGFPLSKAFARPIRTTVLVAAPLAYVFAAAAASYLLPAVFLRVSTGAALPLIPAATFIGALAVLVAGSSWFTRDATARTGLAVAAYMVAGMMVRLLDPFRYAGKPFAAKGVSASPALFVLSATGYLTLVLLITVIYLWILFAVSRQRHGDDERAGSDPRTDRSPRKTGDIMESIRSACIATVHWRCPVSSPIAAEIWFELQYYGIPVLLIGGLLALCIPALIFWGNAVHSGIPVVLAACTLAAPFLAGVGASIWNRRNAPQARLSAFEATRPMGTAELIGLQVLVTSLCIFTAWVVMAASFWLSLPLLADLHLSASPAARAMDAVRQYGVRLLSGAIVGFTVLATLIAFLAALRAYACARGLRVWLGCMGVVLYIVGLLVAVAQGWLDAAVIDPHLWALALAIPAATAVVLGNALAAGILTRGQLTGALLAWLVFAGLGCDLLHAGGVMTASAAIATLALASTFLPLLALGIAPSSIGMLRHA
ncbi:MAG TPA: hypothetical protein VGV09_17715 [Steroidobacteraceae bacterium]|nr:hypothetical protein [Steroidobacteraceae bacterium]